MLDTLLTTKTPFEETNFTNRCQLQMASWLEVDLCSFFLLSPGILSGLNLYRSCVLSEFL